MANIHTDNNRNLSNQSIAIEQWATLLEALFEGSPSVNITAQQMAEELPIELIKQVNIELASRNCPFAVDEKIAA